MQLQGLAGGGQSLRQFPAEETHENFGSRKLHPQRVDGAHDFHLFERLIQASGAGVQHDQAHVGGHPLGFFPQRLQEIRLGLRGFAFENVQALGAIGPQIRRQAAQGDGPAVRLQEALIHLRSRPHPAGAHHHVAQRRSLEGARIVAFAGGALEVAQRPFSNPSRVPRYQQCQPCRTRSSALGASKQ